MEFLLVFTVPLFAFGLSVIAGSVAIHFFGGYKRYGIPFPSWSRAFSYALVAETLAFAVLYAFSFAINFWDYPLGSSPRWGVSQVVEVVFVWFCVTMVSNAAELFVLRARYGIYPRLALVLSLGIINALCAGSELAHKLGFL